MSPEQKRKLLEIEVNLLNKKFGKEIISFGYNKKIERIPFKNPELDDIKTKLDKLAAELGGDPEVTPAKTRLSEEVDEYFKSQSIPVTLGLLLLALA